MACSPRPRAARAGNGSLRRAVASTLAAEPTSGPADAPDFRRAVGLIVSGYRPCRGIHDARLRASAAGRALVDPGVAGPVGCRARRVRRPALGHAETAGRSCHECHARNCLSILVEVYGLPAGVVFCNIAAVRRGGRRVLRCAAINAVLLGGLALTWWISQTDVRPSLVLHGNGTPTLDFSGIRSRGLVASAVAVAIPVACFWLLRPRESDPAVQYIAGRPRTAVRPESAG